jgi:hypothetical protein
LWAIPPPSCLMYFHRCSPKMPAKCCSSCGYPGSRSFRDLRENNAPPKPELSLYQGTAGCCLTRTLLCVWARLHRPPKNLGLIGFEGAHLQVRRDESFVFDSGGWPTLSTATISHASVGVPHPSRPLLARGVCPERSRRVGTSFTRSGIPMRSRRRAVHSDSISTTPSTPVA